MLKQRIITALLLLPLVGVILFSLNLKFFATALLIINYLMAWEWARLSGLTHPVQRSFYSLFVGLLALGIWFFSFDLFFWPAPTWALEFSPDATVLAIWSGVVIWALAILMVLTYPKTNGVWNKGPWVRLLLGTVILIAFWVSMISIRNTDYLLDPIRGSWFLLLMFGIIWAADVGAYAAGKTLGKHKLAPSVSPGKTWEGALGGAVASIVVALVGAQLLEVSIDDWLLFSLAIAGIVAISVFGDLFESALKREQSMKDSSQLLPGHGGLLDRMDSTLAVAPFFLILTKSLGWN